MKTSFGKACDAEERLNNEVPRKSTDEIKDLVYIYAFNSNMEIADDFDQQFERIRVNLDSLELYKEI